MKNKPQQLPPGDYNCRSLDIEFTRDDKERKLVTWMLEVVGGPENGANIEKRYYLTTQNVVEFLKKEFAMLGLTIQRGKDIEEQKGAINGKLVRLTAQTNSNGYSSYYLKGFSNCTAIQADDDDLL